MQVRDATSASLHCHISWSVQKHNMNLSLPSDKNSLFLSIDANNITIESTKIPINISWDEQVTIMPVSWVTKYEK